MNKIRPFLLFFILAGCTAVIIGLVKEKPQTPLESTLAPFYQLIGNVPKTIDDSVRKMIPIDELDEKKYGEAIAQRFQYRANPKDATHIYVNEVLENLKQFQKKEFTYQAVVMNSARPNAFAMPGGIIVVTQGLLDILESEGELLAILAHEMGHVERSHCLNAVKYELLAKKTGNAELGQLVDIATVLLLRHSFSKTQENEADNYAFQVMENLPYDPACLSSAFQRLLDFQNTFAAGPNTPEEADIIRDYLSSHPPVKIRIEKYAAQAAKWWRQSQGREQRYVGKKNLVNQQAFPKKQYADEWKTGH